MGSGARILLATLVSVIFLIIYDILVVKPKIDKMKRETDMKKLDMKKIERQNASPRMGSETEAPDIQKEFQDIPERGQQYDQNFAEFRDDNLLVLFSSHGINRIELNEFALEVSSEEKFYFMRPIDFIFVSGGRFIDNHIQDGILIYDNGLTGTIDISKISKYSFELKFSFFGDMIDLTPLFTLRKSAYGDSELIYGDTKVRNISDGIGKEAVFFGERGRYFVFLAQVPGKTFIKSADKSRSILYSEPVRARGKAELKIRFYSGPKDEDELYAFSPFSAELASLGFFGGISKILLFILKNINSLVGNWGVSIIILSFLVRLAFFPLSSMSIKSMKKLKDIQPQIEKIKQKYKDDKDAMSKEIFELYRREKINPFSGCLPLLIQIPIFIALYQALLNYLDLRHAPFILWIEDLSSPDKFLTLKFGNFSFDFNLLPLIMGLTFFIQQIITPQTSQDVSMKILNYSMPVVFTIILWNIPSGLQLYWITVNILGIVQQVIAMRTS